MCTIYMPHGLFNIDKLHHIIITAASLNLKLNQAASALLKSEEEVKRLNLEHPDRQSEAKRLHDALHEVNSKATNEVAALKDKTSELANEAGLIFKTLKSWPSMPN